MMHFYIHHKKLESKTLPISSENSYPMKKFNKLFAAKEELSQNQANLAKAQKDGFLFRLIFSGTFAETFK